MLLRWWHIALAAIAGLLIQLEDYRPDDIDLATAPHHFSAVGWELDNLPDKWLRRTMRAPRSLFGNGNRLDASLAEVDAYFDRGQLIREIDLHLIRLEALPSVPPDLAAGAEEMRQGQLRLREMQSQARPAVEETLESAVADTLQSLGFRAWTGVFPPVDTVLTGSPTVLITSPRDRIARHVSVVLQTGLTNAERERIESRVETRTDLSALVVNTGGIAFYPSITLPDAGLEFAMEVIAHEWVHQWLWFRPLGQRYFEDGDLTVINETVADIAGREIGELALSRLRGTEPPAVPHPSHGPTAEEHRAAVNPMAFDFQAEMRATRVRVDELLAAGDVAGAEAYMEERRRQFVANGYHLRRLNQAYFAFHGAYGTTGAAGVNVIGQQVQELRRRSDTLADFLRAAAQITGPEDLAKLSGSAIAP